MQINTITMDPLAARAAYRASRVKPTRDDCVWAAGFFEGEGSVSIRSRPNGRSLATLWVEVTQVDPTPVDWLNHRWEGGIYSYQPRVPNARAFVRWTAAATKAATFLRDIQPFLVRPVVRARAELALAFQESKISTWANRTVAYKENQQRCIDEMTRLNHRGAPTVAVLAGSVR